MQISLEVKTQEIRILLLLSFTRRLNCVTKHRPENTIFGPPLILKFVVVFCLEKEVVKITEFPKLKRENLTCVSWLGKCKSRAFAGISYLIFQRKKTCLSSFKSLASFLMKRGNIYQTTPDIKGRKKHSKVYFQHFFFPQDRIRFFSNIFLPKSQGRLRK